MQMECVFVHHHIRCCQTHRMQSLTVCSNYQEYAGYFQEDLVQQRLFGCRPFLWQEDYRYPTDSFGLAVRQ